MSLSAVPVAAILVCSRVCREAFNPELLSSSLFEIWRDISVLTEYMRSPHYRGGISFIEDLYQFVGGLGETSGVEIHEHHPSDPLPIDDHFLSCNSPH